MAVVVLEIGFGNNKDHACNSCFSRLSESIQSVDGVREVSLEPQARQVKVNYDSETLDEAALRSTFEQIRDSIQATVERKSISVSGLTCEDCARKVSSAVRKIPGVILAEVNINASALVIEYHPQDVETSRIISTVKRLGYDVPASQSGASHQHEHQKASFWSSLRGRLTVLSGVALIAGVILEFAFSQPQTSSYLYILSGLLAGGYVMRGAWFALREKSLDTDVLMAAAALGATYLGDWREAAAVLFLYTLGETLEAYTVSRARGALKGLIEGFPKNASVVKGGIPQLVAIEHIEVGDEVLVRPGEKLPVDGVVVSGTSEINESLVTGESIPRERSVGDEVYAGSINGSGAIVVKTTRLTQDNTVNRIIHMVEEAQAHKAPSQRITERFGRVYTPMVLAIAIGITIVGPLALGEPFAESFRKALILLTVSCPCALVLASPIAVVSALTAAAKNGVLIKGGKALEELGKTKAICFDKTGTLSVGKLSVMSVHPVEGVSQDDLLILAASVESASEHIIGEAVVRHAHSRMMNLLPVTDFRAMPGRGASGEVGGQTVIVGNQQLLEEVGYDLSPVATAVQKLSEEGNTVLYLGVDGKLQGAVALKDTDRAEAHGVLRQLRDLGIRRTVMLTGDRPGPASQLAEKLGLDGWQASMLPEDKLRYVDNLIKEQGSVAMVGDGINDAPALAEAGVGIAIGTASGASAETADVVLMTGDLTRLPYAIQLGQRSLSIIRANIAIAVGVVVSLVVLTLFGQINLIEGVLGHEGSALLVVANGMRLLRARPGSLGGSGFDRLSGRRELSASTG